MGGNVETNPCLPNNKWMENHSMGIQTEKISKISTLAKRQWIVLHSTIWISELRRTHSLEGYSATIRPQKGELFALGL